LADQASRPARDPASFSRRCSPTVTGGWRRAPRPGRQLVTASTSPSWKKAAELGVRDGNRELIMRRTSIEWPVKPAKKSSR
jgi:hypothetical protein